jgi:RES domain
MSHYARFMTQTKEAPGWVSQFRELVMDLDAMLHDLCGKDPAVAPALDPDSYVESQALAKALRKAGSDGLVYRSLRDATGQCLDRYRHQLSSSRGLCIRQRRSRPACE